MQGNLYIYTNADCLSANRFLIFFEKSVLLNELCYKLYPKYDKITAVASILWNILSSQVSSTPTFLAFWKSLKTLFRCLAWELIGLFIGES